MGSPTGVIDRETLAASLEALFREEYSDEYLAAEDAAFTRLGLLGPDDDLGELHLGLYDSQVLAYYDARTDTFSLVGSDAQGRTPSNRSSWPTSTRMRCRTRPTTWMPDGSAILIAPMPSSRSRPSSKATRRPSCTTGRRAS